MDPHMTDNPDYELGNHRRLHQRLAPPSPVTTKKKKLVNFKVSRRFRGEKKERRGSNSSSGSVYMSTDATDIPLQEIKDSWRDEKMAGKTDTQLMNKNEKYFGGKLDNRRGARFEDDNLKDDDNDYYRARNRNKTGDRDYDLNYNKQREENSYRDSTEFRSLMDQRMDTRSLKERREDFKRLHERRNNPMVGERRGGILHIDGERDARGNDTDNNGNPLNQQRRLSDPKLQLLASQKNDRRRWTLDKIDTSSIFNKIHEDEEDGNQNLDSKTDLQKTEFLHSQMRDSRRWTLDKIDTSSLFKQKDKKPSDNQKSDQIPKMSANFENENGRKSGNCPRSPPSETSRRGVTPSCLRSSSNDSSHCGTVEKVDNSPMDSSNRRKSDSKTGLLKSQTNIDSHGNGGKNNDNSKGSVNTKSILAQRRRSAGATLTRRQDSTTSWDRLRGATLDSNSRMSTIVEMITTRRRSSLAPSIWTPAVPKPSPGPRPPYFSEQEERGNRMFTISFITRCPKARQQRPNSRQQQKRTNVAPIHRVPTTHWETSGKQYLSWLQNLTSNPSLQDGQLLLGLEIGVQFSAMYLKEWYPDGGGGAGERRLMEGCLSNDSTFSQGVYEEVVSWIPELLVTCPSDPSQWARCYILLGFMTLEGQLDKKMEDLWKEWTGALYVYCNVDDDLGLKKLTFYRRHSQHQSNLFSYLVLIELDTVTRKNCLTLLDFVYRMRLKNMSGYISVYQYHNPDSGLTMIPGGSPVSLRATSPIASYSTDSYIDKTSIDLDRMTL